MEDFAKFQDVFGQLPFLQTYTVVSLGFPVRMDNARPEIVHWLENAALKLTNTFPWLAGQVVKKGESDSSSGLQTIQPYGANAVIPPLVHAKDCTDLCATFSDLAAAKAPFSMLDGGVLSPRPGLPAPSEGVSPVILIQANFIGGGLILTFAGQHNTMDMTGLGQVVRLFAKALRGEPFTDAEISEGNRDRSTVISLLPSNEPLEDHSMMTTLPKQEQSSGEPKANGVQNLQSRWAYFRFPTHKLIDLKSLASASQPTTNSVKASPAASISTNDAITAFTWQRITAARLSTHRTNLPSDPASPPPILCRALSSRGILNVSPSYIGHMVYCTFTSFPSPTTTPLSTVATSLRTALRSVTPHQVRSFVTLIDRTPDKRTISYGARLDLDRDVMFSSWVSLGFAETAFGGLGKLEWARRPRFAGMPGLVYLMPRTVEGHVDAAICLGEEDMRALEGDEEMRKFTEWIG